MAKEDKKKELEQLFEDVQGIGRGELSSELLANPEDLISIEEMEGHDYYADLAESVKESTVVVDSMAKLYLSD